MRIPADRHIEPNEPLDARQVQQTATVDRAMHYFAITTL